MADVAQPFDGVAGQMAQAGWYRDAPMREGSHVYGTPPTGISSGSLIATYGLGNLALSLNGLGWSMGLGRAHVRGMYYERTETPATGSSPANTNATLSRIDRLVLRRDLGAAAADKCKPVLLQGTPASSPAVPSLQQAEDGQWDMPLFRWVVGPNSSTTLTDVRDERRWSGIHGTPIGPRIAGTFQRTDNSDNINANGDTQLRAIPTEAVGPWRVWNPGTGIGVENDVPARYRIAATPLTAITSSRYEQVHLASGTVAGRTPVAIGSSPGGFGGSTGYIDIDAPNGIQAVFEYFQSGSAGGTFRAGHRWSIEWLRPLG